MAGWFAIKSNPWGRSEGERRYCQELWIGGAWLGGFLPIFLVFTAFDLNTINERNTSTHQG